MIDETRLRQLYLNEQRSIRDIAAREGVPARLIYDALIRYRIPRRPAGSHSRRAETAGPPFDEARLRQLYTQEQRSIREIAALHQVSTRMVYGALIRYRIPRRPTRQRRPAPPIIPLADGVLDQAALRRMYEEEGRSIAAIAAEMGCAPARIRSALIRWGIARRRRGRHSQARGDRQGGEQQVRP